MTTLSSRPTFTTPPSLQRALLDLFIRCERAIENEGPQEELAEARDALIIMSARVKADGTHLEVVPLLKAFYVRVTEMMD